MLPLDTTTKDKTAQQQPVDDEDFSIVDRWRIQDQIENELASQKAI